MQNNDWQATVAGIFAGALTYVHDALASGSAVTLRGFLGALAFITLGYFSGGRKAQ